MKALAGTLSLLAALVPVFAASSPLENLSLAGPAPYSKGAAVLESAPVPIRSRLLRGETKSTSNHVPGLYIIEYDNSNSLGKRGLDVNDAFHQYLASVEPAEAVAKGLKGVKGIKYQTRYTYTDPSIFHGVSIKLANPADAAALRGAPGVKRVYQAQRFSVPAFAPQVVNDAFAASASRGVGHSSNSKSAKGKSIKARDSTYSTNDTFTPHVMTGVDKLHAQGYFGKGMVVGIIDSGIDYTHPALNAGRPAGTACFGAGCQVIGGHDLVGDAYNGDTDDPQPDSDPFADCPGSGHGTHVSGTIAARDAGSGFTGVVPEASLKMYRVFGCGEESTSTDDVIIQAMMTAFFDDVDLISMSLGDNNGWSESPTANIASRISDKGIPVIVANGNSADGGAFYASSPAVGNSVTSVASIDNIELTGFNVSTIGAQPIEGSIIVLAGAAWTFAEGQSSKLQVVPVTNDTNVEDEACNPIDAKFGPDDVVLVGRGGCFFTDKLQNIADAGGQFVLGFNSAGPYSQFYLTDDVPGQQAAALTRNDGLYLKSQVAAGASLYLDFSEQQAVTVIDHNTGGTASSFTSITPDWDLKVVPSVAAPGGNILSTWPVKQGSYAILSGTSMATPFMAGSTALWRSIKGKDAKSAVDLRSIFTATANPVVLVNTSLLDTVAKQGGGLIDVYGAVTSQTEISPGSIALNDTAHFDGERKIVVINTGSEPQSYQISHVPAATMLIMDPKIGWFQFFPVPTVPNAAQVTLSATTLDLGPGESQWFTATFEPPQGLDSETIPVFSGYIRVASTSQNQKPLQVPYMGVFDDLSKENPLDVTDFAAGAYLPALVDAQGNIIRDDKQTFTLSPASGNNSADAPTLYWLLRMGTALESVDLVPADTSFVATTPINDNSTSSTNTRRELKDDVMRRVHRRGNRIHTPHKSMHGRAPVSTRSPASKYTEGKYGDVQTVGNVAFWTYAARDDLYKVSQVTLDQVVATQNLSSSVNVTSGEYRLLLRVQKLFTDPSEETSYESYLSHAFTVNVDGPSQ